jgi:D-3-phosphoglycerate dehydrogenase
MTTESRTTRPRVLVFERMDPTDASIRWLEQQGLDLTLGRPMWQAPYSRYSRDEIVEAARGHVAVMGASGARFSADVIRSLPDLKYISKFGVGVDTIDLEAASARGILISNTPEKSEVSDVAEHTVALILALRKQLNRWTSDYMRAGGWRPGPFASSIAGSTVGLIGLGHIGQAVARRLAAWNIQILGFDPHHRGTFPGVTITDLETLLRESDVISLHASPTPENHHLIDEEALSKMKRDCIVINTARASLVDTNALCRAVERGQIAGAGIDVFDEEPPDTAGRMFQIENIIVTPHAAAWTMKGLENIGWHAARNLVAMITGQGHADLVNRTAT